MSSAGSDSFVATMLKVPLVYEDQGDTLNDYIIVFYILPLNREVLASTR